MIKGVSDTIPKLDRASYLFETVGYVEDGLSFDEIRGNLIRMRRESDQERLIEDRRGASSIRQLKARTSSTTFWSNARDALRELMRLGLVQHDSLPSRRVQLSAHKGKTFRLTESGQQFLALATEDVWQFRHRFVQAMEIAHPYLRQLRIALTARDLFFPRIQKSDVPGDAPAWKAGIPEPLIDLAATVSEAVYQAQGLRIPPDRLEAKMRPYLTAAWKRRDTDLKANVFSKWAVKTVNDVAIRSLVGFYGMPMDFVTFRSAVALLTDLSAIWHTRALPGRRGWTLWSTSEGTCDPQGPSGESPAVQALAGTVWFRPRAAADELVRDRVVERFLALEDRRGGFALVHVLRAEVCHSLKIHGREFNAVLGKMHSQELIHEKYAINLDRSGGHELPPSEDPFRIGNRAFYLITLLPRS